MSGMKIRYASIAFSLTILALLLPTISYAQTESPCMNSTDLGKILRTPPHMPQYPQGYRMQCATKVGSAIYENYVPNGTATNTAQEIPSAIQSPIQIVPYSGSLIAAELSQGQSAQIPVKISIAKGYQFFSVRLSSENIPPHIQSWIDPQDSSFFIHDPANPNLSNGTIYVYVDSDAKPGSYDILIDATGSVQNPSGNNTELNQIPIGVLHLTISGSSKLWMDVGQPDMQRANICENMGFGTTCSGFVAYEEYPITVYGQNEQVTMSAPDLPAGKYLRFIPNETVATPVGTQIKMITSGIVTPGVPNAIFTPVVTLAAKSNDDRATSYIQIASTQNMSIISAPHQIEFLGRFGGDGHAGNGIFGVVYNPPDYNSNPLHVKLDVLGMQNGNAIDPMPSWLSVSIPTSSFDLVPTIPYFFTIDFTSNNASLGTYPVAIGENVGGSNFVQDVGITIYNPPVFGGPIPSSGSSLQLGPGPNTPYQVPSANGNSWMGMVGFGAIAGIAAVGVSVYVMRIKIK